MDHNNLLAQVSHPMPTLTGIGPQPGADQGVSSLENILSVTVGVLSVIAIIFFAIQIIFAGYSFMSSQGDEKKLAAARDRLTNGILGVTIVIIALGFASLLAQLLGIKGIFDLTTMFNALKF